MNPATSRPPTKRTRRNMQQIEDDWYAIGYESGKWGNAQILPPALEKDRDNRKRAWIVGYMDGLGDSQEDLLLGKFEIYLSASRLDRLL